MEKYGTARQAIDDNTTRRMRFSCWITKAIVNKWAVRSDKKTRKKAYEATGWP